MRLPLFVISAMTYATACLLGYRGIQPYGDVACVVALVAFGVGMLKR